jgi:hypothetical protein
VGRRVSLRVIQIDLQLCSAGRVSTRLSFLRKFVFCSRFFVSNDGQWNITARPRLVSVMRTPVALPPILERMEQRMPEAPPSYANYFH